MAVKQASQNKLFEFDHELLSAGTLLIGLDEVGRGCLAGPLCTGAFAYDLSNFEELSEHEDLLVLNDSKKLNATKRSQIVSALRSLRYEPEAPGDKPALVNVAYSLSIIPAAEIDETGIVPSLWKSMRRNLAEIFNNLSNARKLCPEKSYSKIVILVDGPKKIVGLDQDFIDHHFLDAELEHLCITRGDSKSAAIAAASNLAKHSRDQYMQRIASDYPSYSWDSNVGYGTKAHREAIVEDGLTDLHRRSFCSNYAN